MKKLLLILFLILTPLTVYSAKETPSSSNKEQTTEESISSNNIQETNKKIDSEKLGESAKEIATINLSKPENIVKIKLATTIADQTKNQIPSASYMSDSNYIPVEIRLGSIIIDGFGFINEMLYPFFANLLTTLLIIFLAFWLSGEAYQMINSGKTSLTNGTTIVKKIFLVIIWTAIIQSNPAQVFAYIMGPIIQMGSNITDFIITAMTGMPLDNTCDNIHRMVQNNTDTSFLQYPLLSPEAKANILCLTARISKLYTQFIVLGFKWMGQGLLLQPLTFLIGLTLVIMFIYIGFKFMLETIGIIIDLIIALLLLPFCAIKECFSGGISYKGLEGIPQQLFGSIVSIFSFGDYKGLITKILKSVLYFWILAIIIGICYEMMAYTLNLNPNILDSATLPSQGDMGFMTILLAGILTCYLIKKAPEYAKTMGGAFDSPTGESLKSETKKLYDWTKKAITDMMKKKTSDK